MSEIKNVFISHIHEDDDRLGKLKDLCSGHNLDIKDGSINSEKPNNAKDPDYIMNQIIKPRVDWASVLVVYISPETKDSEWVEKEIEYAQEKNKRIVGIWANEHKDCEPPEALVDYADALVGWHGKNIVSAITGEFDGFETPDGEPKDRTSINRHAC